MALGPVRILAPETGRGMYNVVGSTAALGFPRKTADPVLCNRRSKSFDHYDICFFFPFCVGEQVCNLGRNREITPVPKFSKTF